MEGVLFRPGHGLVHRADPHVASQGQIRDSLRALQRVRVRCGGREPAALLLHRALPASGSRGLSSGRLSGAHTRRGPGRRSAVGDPGRETSWPRCTRRIAPMASPDGANVYNTSLFIGWDEPGGTYDHVPPGPVPPPDPSAPAGQMGFRFDRSGYRVPAILISPWVERPSRHRRVPSHFHDRHPAASVEPR